MAVTVTSFCVASVNEAGFNVQVAFAVTSSVVLSLKVAEAFNPE